MYVCDGQRVCERESISSLSERVCTHSRDRGKDGQCGCNECMCSTDSFYFNGTCHPIVSLDTVTEVSHYCIYY